LGLTGDDRPGSRMAGERESDTELVRRVAAGDAGAFSTLVERYQNPVYNLTARMLGADTGEDAAQEVFVRAFRGLPRFRRQAAFRTWLLRIAANVCIDHSRRRRRPVPGRNPLDQYPVAAPAGGGAGSAPRLGGRAADLGADPASRAVDPSPGPPEVVLRRERDRAVSEAVASLPPHYRMVVVLHYAHGLGYREIAAVCGIAPRAVETRLYRARALLRERLGPWLGPPGRSPPALTGRKREPLIRTGTGHTNFGGGGAGEPTG